MSNKQDCSIDSVQVVTEALIREHLSKRKHIHTLAAYNSEQPKSPLSITKRSVLQQLLGLEQAALEEAADARAHNKTCTSSSILELWVKQQLAQSASVTVGSSSVLPESHSTPNSSISGKLQTDQADSQALKPKAAADMSPRRTPGVQCAVPSSCTASSSSSSSRPNMSGGAAGPAVGSTQQCIMFGQGSSSHQAGQHLQPQSAAPLAPKQLQHSSHPMQPQSAAPVPRPLAAFSENPSATSQHAPRQQQLQPLHGPVVPASLRQVHVPSTDLKAAAASNAAAVVVPSSKAARETRMLEHQLQTELVLEDLDVEDFSSNSTDQQTAATATSSSASGQQTAAPSGPSRLFSGSSNRGGGGGGGHNTAVRLPELQPLLPDQQRQLSVLFWGDGAAGPDAAWSQGLLFNNIPRLEWGLVQLAGGPCGVLASIQAHLVATLMEQGLWGADLQPAELLGALIHSLATIIWTVRSSSTATVVMLPQAMASVAARGLCDAAQITRSAQVATATSLAQLQAHLTAAIPQYCTRKGWGLLLLLYSLLLTRGCSVVRQDMDDPCSCLVDHHGYCSMELVNLLLTGAAVSNVFDGSQHLGAMDEITSSSIADAGDAGDAVADGADLLRGVSCQARVGLLTLFEWYRYVEVGHNLKCPQLPVWVVCSESHFTILALAAAHWQQPARGAGNGTSSSLAAGCDSRIEPAAGAAVVLDFYDGFANVECPIKLALLPAAAGGWSSKMELIAEDRGVWQGQSIPPLECVIETKWKDVEITWHGSDPIL